MRGRKIGIGVLLVFGTLFWTLFGLGLWAQRQALDTDNWVDTSTALLEDEEIREALGFYIVDRVYSSDAVKERIEQVLPERLDRLAGPAASGLKELARRNAPRALGSAAALNAWREANRVAHETLLKVINGDVLDQDVTLDLKSLVQTVATETGLPAGVADRLPPDVAQLQVVRPDQLDTAKDALDAFEAAVWILLVLALLCFAAALYLSRDRRRTALTIGACLIFAGVALIALRRLGERAVVDALADAPNAHAVADDVWDIATSLMVDVSQGSILFGAFVVSGAWLAGPGRRATSLRRALSPWLRERPGATRAALGVLILLLVIWGPVPWTRNFVPLLIFTVGAFLWLEWIRRRVVEEFPDVPSGEWSRRMRSGLASLRSSRAPEQDKSAVLTRLADLHDRGVLDDAEFRRERASVLES